MLRVGQSVFCCCRVNTDRKKRIIVWVVFIGEMMSRYEVSEQAVAVREILNITLLASEWKSSAGGLSTFNRELAIHLSQIQNVGVSLLVPEGACNEGDKREARSFGISILDAKECVAVEPLLWLSNPPQDHKIDVIVGHGVKLGCQVQLIKRQVQFQNCKWVHMVHTEPEDLSKYKDYSNPISRGEEKHWDEVDLCKCADLVVPVGPRLGKAYHSYLQECKKDEDFFELIPGLFEREFGDLPAKQKPKDESNDFIVLLCGCGDEEDFQLKGYNTAVKAFADQRLKGKHYSLLFVGSPEGRQDEVRERLLKYGITNEQLTVREFVKSRQRMKELFCEVDMVIMPSKSEGFGLVALEALSAGLPILVGNNSGFARAMKSIPNGKYIIVGDSGDSGDPAKWAEAIEDVRDRHGVVLEESEMLRERYSKKFCWQKQCEELVARLWKMVCGAPAAQALAADDVIVQCPTGVSESVCHTNPTAMQQHFKEGAVTSGTGREGTAGGDLTLPELAVHLIKLKVKTSGLRKEQQKAVYELLINHATEYMKSRNYTTVKVPRVGAFLEYLELTYDVSCRTFNLGSLIISLDCKTLKGLDKLWNDYLSGHLTKVAKNHLVTDEMMKSLRLKTINLKTSIDKENYVNCRKIFPESSGPCKDSEDANAGHRARQMVENYGDTDHRAPQMQKNNRDTLQDLSKLLHEFPHFVNRKTDELSLIVKCLDPENRQCQGVFIDGAPGIGKTILATEAANKLRNDNEAVVVAYIDCNGIDSFESAFAATVIEQICRSPPVDDLAAEIKKRLIVSKDHFYILFLDNFECFLEENSNQEDDQPSTAAAPSRDCRERVIRFIGEIARRPTNIKFLVTSSEKVLFLPMLAMEAIHLNPFDKDESSKLLEKVRCADKISIEECEELSKSCSGIPLVLHTLISLQEDLKCFVKLPAEQRTKFLWKMKTLPEEKKIGFRLELCFQRLTPQAQLTLLRLCLYKGLFTPDKAAKIFCSPESSENQLKFIVLELGRCNLLHLQKFKDTNKYTFLTVIREHFKLKAKQEYSEEIHHARGLMIDYLIPFLKETFKEFLDKNSVKSAIEEFSAEKENVMQLVEWIDKGEMDEERVKKSIDVFNITGEMLAKIMAKFSYENVYKSLVKKCKEMGDQRRLAESLTSLGIKEIFNCICPTGLCDKAIQRVRRFLDEADKIQTQLRVNKGNSRAQCLAKLGRCLVRRDEKERGKAMIQEAICIREAAVETSDDHEEEGGENVCYVMLGATYNDMAVALSFENRHREAVDIRKNQVMPIYTDRLGYHPFTATILNHLSNDHRDLKKFEAAEEYAKKALRIRRELLADHRDTTKSLFDVGVALKANKKFREAKDLLEQCKTMQEKVVNDCTLEEKVEEELTDVNNRLLEMEQSEGQDQ
ncbi:uncharacterized protein [Acropora muricata]|uniref:uncharacterized protein isoform X2 n=1 Tax=Acropora muricata TaxID=159855 RepID=UPI0034E43FA5